MNAREVAFNILLDNEIKKSYSNISLNLFLKNSKLQDKDRGLVTELVYGTIEKKLYLDSIINKFSKIKVKKMSNNVKIILRMSCYQILFLDKVGSYAVINEAVNLTKKKDRKSASFVNAILRNIDRNKDNFGEIKLNDINSLSLYYSFEKWIVEKFVKEYGLNESVEILKELSKKPKLYVRLNQLKSHDFENYKSYKEFVIEQLNKDGIETREVDRFNEVLEVINFKRIDENKLYKEGYISIQDISSMLVAKALNPEKNKEILDLCAAPGGKSTHVAEIVDNTGKIISQDIYSHKVKLIENYANRLGIKNISAVEGDATKYNSDYENKFDYVICDVPCSGMGIVRRKPEIKYKKEEEVKELSKIQLQILENASRYVKEDGIIIYSTCTIFSDENINIIESFLENNKDFKIDSIENLDQIDENFKEGYLTILPSKHKMDGFFICRLKKIKKIQ